jgi:DNA-binding response OmpR family regulator
MADFAAIDPQLVLIDIGLPLFNGYRWCREIRGVSNVPIMFISSASDNMNIVMAMEAGADDFVAKPFDLNVLVVKVRALLRRAYDLSAAQDILEHGGALLSVGGMSVSFGEQKAQLTKNELRILQTLWESSGKAVSREELMQRLWETDSYVDDNTLTVNVTRLRKKLAGIGLGEMVLTKKGLGYMVE